MFTTIIYAEENKISIEIVEEFNSDKSEKVNKSISRYWWHYSSGSDPFWIMGTSKLYDSSAKNWIWTRESINENFNTLLTGGKETIEFEVPSHIKNAINSGKKVKIEIGVNNEFFINSNTKFRGELSGELSKIVVENSCNAKMSNDKSKVIFTFIPYYQIDEYKDFNKALQSYGNNLTKFDYKYPYIREGFGEMIYSMYSLPSPTSLGTSFGTSKRLANLPAKSGFYSDYLVNLTDISRSGNDGLLTNSKEFLLLYNNEVWQYKYGSQMKIGNGTMNNGGAVGILPYFPFSAHFYIEDEIIEDPIDPIIPDVPESSTDSGGDDFSANSIGVIKADNRSSEMFDVTKGVPTGENLYVNVLAKEYLYSEEYLKVSGTKTYPITVERSYNLFWTTREKRDLPKTYCLDKSKCINGGVCKGHANYEYYDKPHTDTEKVTTIVNIERDYEYYIISNFELYKIKNTQIMNDVLSGGKISIPPSSSYCIPTVNLIHDEKESTHIIEPVLPVTVTLPDISLNSSSVSNADWSGALEAAEAKVAQIKCKSDKLEINSKIILSDKQNDKKAEKPDKIATSNQISNNVLYKNGLTISNNILNGTYTSSGEITYERVESSVNPRQSTIIIKPLNINPVVVHTPVYCDINLITDESAKSRQLSDSIKTIKAGSTQQIQVISTGQHKNITGYGVRDYSKYTQSNEIKCSFDFYIGTDKNGIYVNKNIWYSIGKQKDLTIYIPEWSTLGEQTIELKTKANNSNGNNSETNANLNLHNSIATSIIRTYLEPKLYDFTVSYIDDIFWSNHFTNGIYKKIDLSKVITSKILPVMPQKNSDIKFNMFSVKRGYNFYFDLKTNGEYKGEATSIQVKPSFYYVDRNGKNRREVDIYYFTKGKLIDASETNNVNLYTAILNSWVRGIQAKEINNTIAAYRNILGSQGELISDSILKQSKIPIGSAYSIKLESDLRSFVGNITSLPNNVSQTKGLTSISRWSGQYFLPNNAVAVPKGTFLRNSSSITENSSIFLKNGYIIVNFDMFYDNNGVNYRYYPQWKKEGYNLNQGFDLKYGDIVLYETDHNASEDYNIGK
jgi:hypothetical protein